MTHFSLCIGSVPSKRANLRFLEPFSNYKRKFPHWVLSLSILNCKIAYKFVSTFARMLFSWLSSDFMQFVKCNLNAIKCNLVVRNITVQALSNQSWETIYECNLYCANSTQVYSFIILHHGVRYFFKASIGI